MTIDTYQTTVRTTRFPLDFEWIDILLEAERKEERRIAGLLLTQTVGTIQEILSTRVEPELDQDVKAFWSRVKEDIPSIVMAGELDALKTVNSHIKDHRLFWKWLQELGQQPEYGDIRTVLMNLRALRLSTAGFRYVLKNELIQKTFEGWL